MCPLLTFVTLDTVWRRVKRAYKTWPSSWSWLSLNSSDFKDCSDQGRWVQLIRIKKSDFGEAVLDEVPLRSIVWNPLCPTPFGLFNSHTTCRRPPSRSVCMVKFGRQLASCPSPMHQFARTIKSPNKVRVWTKEICPDPRGFLQNLKRISFLRL